MVAAVAPSVVGSLSQYDHVAYCIPRGTVDGGGSPNWIAYGYFGWYRTVYNGEWCSFVSVQMHEIGHNLDLHHSSQGGSEYGDQSGYMGYSYSQHEGPAMCFNAAKNNELGWYADRQLTINPYGGTATTVLLAGVSDYALATEEYTVVLKILTPSSANHDLYLAYNRAAGVNSGTAEFPNLVTLVGAGEPGTRTISVLYNTIAEGAVLPLPDFEQSGFDLHIEFCEVRSMPFVHAKLSVYLDDGVQVSTCSGSPESPTAAPASPTAPPAASPTASPTLDLPSGPTAPPVEAPAAAPTASPTKAPVAPPASYPPSSEPVASPTSAPVAAPTYSPTAASPTLAPFAMPTYKPTYVPTAIFETCLGTGDVCQSNRDCCSQNCKGNRKKGGKTCRA